MNRLRITYTLVLLLLAALFAASCAKTYVYKENEYLLKKNKIVITNSRHFPKSELSAYLKQSEKANQFMGLRWIFGKPVLLDESLIWPTRNGMLRHLEYKGYYNSAIDTTVVRKNHKATVTYLVMAAIFLRPSSPSLCISSSFGIAMVISCMIMEDVMYGVMFRANTDMFKKEPPVKASKKLKASPECCSNQLLKKVLSTPGTGS
jgi:hypothetical protein